MPNYSMLFSGQSAQVPDLYGAYMTGKQNDQKIQANELALTGAQLSNQGAQMKNQDAQNQLDMSAAQRLAHVAKGLAAMQDDGARNRAYQAVLPHLQKLGPDHQWPTQITQQDAKEFADQMDMISGGGMSASDLKALQMKIMQQNADANTLTAAAKAKQAVGGSVGPDGKSVDAWAIRTLLSGDPSSPEYQAAYNDYSKPKTQYVQSENGLIPVTTSPDMSAYRKPKGSTLEQPIGPMSAPPSGGLPPPTPPGGAGQAIPGTAKAPTEDQAKAGGWYRQAMNAYANMTDAIRVNPSAARPTIGQKVASLAGQDAETLASSPERQRYKNAASAFSEAVLRAATGAGITKDEAQQKINELTPGMFDSDELVQQKQQAMLVYLDALKSRAGNTVKDVEDKTKSAGKYSVGQIVEHGGKKYRVTGGDLNDPDVEEVK